jgi:hypothetical protein
MSESFMTRYEVTFKVFTQRRHEEGLLAMKNSFIVEPNLQASLLNLITYPKC